MSLEFFHTFKFEWHCLPLPFSRGYNVHKYILTFLWQQHAGNKCLPALVASPQAFPSCHVTCLCQKNANMLIRPYRACRECWGCQSEHEQSPHAECFPRCHFLIPSNVFECRSLVELKHTEILLGSVQHSLMTLTSSHLTCSIQID